MNVLPTRGPDNAEQNVGPPSSVELTPSGRSTSETDNSNIWKPKLDPDASYFDFSQMISRNQKPQTLPDDRGDRTLNRNVAGGGSNILISHMGEGNPPLLIRDERPIQFVPPPPEHNPIFNTIHDPLQWPSREPRIINRPLTIEPSRRAPSWPSRSHRPNERPGPNSNTETDQPSIWQPPPEFPVPFQGIQTPQSNSINEWNWFVTPAFMYLQLNMDCR